MIKIEDYSSRWDYMADRENVPRNPSYDDKLTEFTIVGRFIGNWREELDFLRKKYNDGIGFNFLSKLPKDTPYTRTLDLADMTSAGISETSVFVSKINPEKINESINEIPTIKKMIDWFEFSGLILPKIHIQKPGQIFPYHFDDLTTHRKNSDINIDAKKFARVEVMLLDWDYGHFWGIGNNIWKQWRAGEIMFHPWNSIPHGTANAGRTPRINLQITGEITDKILEKLSRNNGDIIL